MAENDRTLRPSGSPEWLGCPGSALATKHLPDNSSAAARLGTAGHEVGEKCLRNGTEAMDYMGDIIEVEGHNYEVDANMINAVQFYVDKVLQQARDVGARELHVEKRVTLPYVRDDGEELGGTSDCIFLSGDGRNLFVADYKHGIGVTVDVEENSQLMIYGLGAWYELGSPAVETVTLIICQPRTKAGKWKRWQAWTIKISQLRAWEKEVLLPGMELALTPGAPFHPSEKACQWCKIKSDCPARVDTGLRVLTTQAAIIQQTPPRLPNLRLLSFGEIENVVHALDQADFGKWYKESKERITEGLRNGERSAHFKLVQGQGKRSWTDETTMKARCAQYVDVVHEPSTKSPAQIEASLKKTGFTKPQIAEILEGIVNKTHGVQLAPMTSKKQALNAPQVLTPLV